MDKVNAGDGRRTYISIDLKSFYASVECVERNLDPLTTNLVVADDSRTEKTICLAVSPSLKAYGIPGRPRLFQVVQKARECSISYITAKPRMALYMEYSARINGIYFKYVAPEDVHVYSVDEVFIDVTGYLNTYKMSARQLAMTMIQDVLKETGITATAGIGSNLYLCKIAMDIVAKHATADKDGVRIAQLDEASYRRLLWNHRPLTDFWRVGKGTAKRLEDNGLYTMGDIARCSLGKKGGFYNEDLLYKLFGVNAELLIDHAWGWEPCSIADIKAYRPENNSVSSGQVLKEPYSCEKTKLVVREMTELMVLDLVDKGLVTDQIVLTIGYDIENLTRPEIRKKYKGPVTTDQYGRKIPGHAHGTVNLDGYTSSTRHIVEKVMGLYDSIVNPDLLTRRITVAANRIISETEAERKAREIEEREGEQLSFFENQGASLEQKKEEQEEREKERQIQKALLDIKKKYGKNAMLKGTNLQEGATAKERNSQIGGHKA